MDITTHIAELPHRGVVRASGPDAVRLLDGLVTNDLDRLDGGRAVHTALLSPQGKILFAFFVVRVGDDLLIDVARDSAAALAKRLSFYKLRAAADFTDISSEMTVAAAWPKAPADVPRGIIAFTDPRDPGLGVRLLLPSGRIGELGSLEPDGAAYDARRVDLGVPEEGRDFIAADTFPHDADFDLFHGVSFTKGCFIGQEVVSRMQNKAVVRKRVVRIEGPGLVSGAEIRHGAGVIGSVGTVAGGRALAMVRLDRAAEAVDKQQDLTTDGGTIRVDPAAIERYREAVRNKPVIDL